MSDQRADDYLFLGIVLLLAFCLLVLLIRPAGAGLCLTKVEARHSYPGKWLYWHGKDHCWDATPGRPDKPVQRIVHLKRAVSPLVQPEEIQIIESAPTFVPWDARIGIPFTNPRGGYQ